MENQPANKRQNRRSSKNRLLVLLTILLLLAGFFLLDRRGRLNSGLHEAIMTGDAEMAQRLLNSGADPNLRIVIRRPVPASTNPLDMLQRLLNPPKVSPSANYRTALMSVAQNGNQSMVRDLLTHGADPNVQLENGSTALILASKPHHIETIELLLRHHANIHAADKSGRTALLCAADTGAEDAVQMLLEHGANILDTDKQGRTTLFVAAQNGRVESVKRLLKWGANPADIGRTGYPPLLWAAANGSAELLQLFWDRETGAAKEKWGPAALNLAIEAGSAPAVKFLLDRGVSIQARPAWMPAFRPGPLPPGMPAVGSSGGPRNAAGTNISAVSMAPGGTFLPGQKTIPLIAAAQTGSVEIVQMLLEKGAEVNVQDASGLTPLLASMNPTGSHNFSALNSTGGMMGGVPMPPGFPGDSSLKISRMLLKHGADIHAGNRMGQNALFLGGNQSPELVQLLIESGVEVNARDRTGQTALLMISNPKSRRLLIEHGADVNGKDQTGATPLMRAVLFDLKPDIVSLLLARGADVNAANARGQTALTLARQMRRQETVDVLKKAGAKEALSQTGL